MNIKFDFTGKIVLVTGAATGIGKQTALQFAQAGATTLVADFNEKEGKNTSQECERLGVKSEFYQIDISNEQEVDKMAEQILQKYGYIDILISNAGIGSKKSPPLANIDTDEIRSHFNVNAFGFINVVRAFYKNFTNKKQGKIVCTASIQGLRPNAALPHYSAAKAAVLAFVKTTAVELGKYCVNVNAVAPGYVYTPIHNGLLKKYQARMPGRYDDCKTDQDAIARLAEVCPIPRPQTPEDIANAIMFLSADEAKNITGECITVDSGRLLL